MAKGFAIHNAPTDHGGFVPATQMRSSQMGNLFVCAGDGHFCPKCKTWSTVVKSHDHVIFDGKSVAYAGDRLTCGAKLLAQQSHVVGESGNSSTSNLLSNLINNFIPNVSSKYNEQLKISLNNECSDIFNIFTCKVKIGSTYYDSNIDDEGKTIRFYTEKEEQITKLELNLKDNIIYFHDLIED